VVVVAHDSGSSEVLDLVARVRFLCTVISSSSCKRKVEDRTVHCALIIWIQNIESGCGGSGLG
jgi:hypothetical protein